VILKNLHTSKRNSHFIPPEAAALVKVQVEINLKNELSNTENSSSIIFRNKDITEKNNFPI